MTTIAPETDITLIEHLDHNPACEVVSAQTEIPCGDTAAWWVLAKHHCVADETCTHFLCATHYEWVTGGLLVRCGSCKTGYNASRSIVRAERIR